MARLPEIREGRRDKRVPSKNKSSLEVAFAGKLEAAMGGPPRLAHPRASGSQHPAKPTASGTRAALGETGHSGFVWMPPNRGLRI